MVQKAVRRTCIQLVLAFVCGSAPLASFAYQAIFEGWLISDNASDPPIRVVLKLEVNLAGVSGTVKTASPLPGAGVLGGDEQFGNCDLRSDLGFLTLLRMQGRCGPAASSFDGTYTVHSADGKRQARAFRLTRTRTGGQGINEDLSRGSQPPREFSKLTPTRCIKANSACLLACPRGDYNGELLCANRCKQKTSSLQRKQGLDAGHAGDPCYRIADRSAGGFATAAPQEPWGWSRSAPCRG